MIFFISQAVISDARSKHHNSKTNILIADGIIKAIGEDVQPVENAIHISVEGLHIIPGLVELFSDFSEPGFEYRETLETGTAAAASGGFTDVVILPNTKPALDNKAALEAIPKKLNGVNIHPAGSLSKGNDGKELAEMYDLHKAGTHCFTDGKNAVQNADLLLKALLYLKPVNGLVIQLPDNKEIAPQGLMNEGVESTRLGLAGKPAFAEALIVKRDTELAKYTGGRLHITGVSTTESIQAIKKAKAEGVDVSCSVTPMHLVFCDEDLQDYNTNLKLPIPLRTPRERDALKELVLQGEVDLVAVHHWPQHSDHKNCEFEYAKAGATGLQTAFSVLNEITGLDKTVELLSLKPAGIAGIEKPVIEPGNKVSIAMVLPEEEYEFTNDLNRSKSQNNPFTGRRLKGKVVGIINDKDFKFADEK